MRIRYETNEWPPARVIAERAEERELHCNGVFRVGQAGDVVQEEQIRRRILDAIVVLAPEEMTGCVGYRLLDPPIRVPDPAGPGGPPDECVGPIGYDAGIENVP